MNFDINNENSKEKTNSIICETFKNIILSFYPKEDEYFFDLIFSPINDEAQFFQELAKIYKNINNFSDEDPDRKFYGIQNITKIKKTNKTIESIELNKLNTDLIFILLKKILCSSYDEEINIKSLIKSKISKVFHFNNLNSICFIANKLENSTSLFPVNFYAFCISLKILIFCFPEQIKFFHVGVFMNLEQTLFSKNNNGLFFSELFCCYITFLYLSSNILSKEFSSSLCLHFLEDTSIYENFTFHINNNGYNIIKNILTKNEKYDILSLLKEFFNDILFRISIYIHYNISIDTYNEIITFLNLDKKPKYLHIYCDKIIINKKYVNFIKDITNCKELNIHIISNTSLLNSNIDNKINLKDEENTNIRKFTLDGEFIYIENMPSKMRKLKSLKLICNKRPFFLQNETEYKKMYKNICFNFHNKFFNNLNYLEELTLKHITPEQFFSLVNCLNSNNDINLSLIFKMYLEINYSHIKISNNNNGITKNYILNLVDSLVRNSKRISNINQLEIILNNDNFQNKLLLTKENGFYFISLVLELLKNCHYFSLKNFNNYYYPLDDIKPDSKIREDGRKKAQLLKDNEEFSLQDNVHNCKIYSNVNKDLQVVYDGNEFEDFSNIMDLNKALPFLHVVDNKLVKLKPKALLINILKFFGIQKKIPKQFSVCNFNN